MLMSMGSYGFKFLGKRMGLGVAILALGLKYGPEGWDLNLVAGFGLGFAYPRLGKEVCSTLRRFTIKIFGSYVEKHDVS